MSPSWWRPPGAVPPIPDSSEALGSMHPDNGKGRAFPQATPPNTSGVVSMDKGRSSIVLFVAVVFLVLVRPAPSVLHRVLRQDHPVPVRRARVNLVRRRLVQGHRAPVNRVPVNPVPAHRDQRVQRPEVAAGCPRAPPPRSAPLRTLRRRGRPGCLPACSAAGRFPTVERWVER